MSQFSDTPGLRKEGLKFPDILESRDPENPASGTMKLLLNLITVLN